MPGEEPRPMRSRRHIRRSGLAALPLALPGLPRPGLAQGEAWPSRPIRVVVAWAPGGAADTIARRLAPKLSDSLGRPVALENRSGAAGTIGAAEVARAAPDGHTPLAMDNACAMPPCLFQRLPFDHATAFRPVTVTAFSPVMIAVRRDAPWADLAAPIAAAKREPEKITYGTGGIGSAPHFATVAFAQAAGISLFRMPFRGAGDAVTDANQVWRLPLHGDGAVTKAGVFAHLHGGPGGPDGLAWDRDGNPLFAQTRVGTVWRFNARAEPTLAITSGASATNPCLGGAGGRDLFISESETGSILRARREPR